MPDLQRAANDQQSTDPQLESKVEILRNLVESYMKLVYKTHKDFMPKIITKHTVCLLENFVATELPAILYRPKDDQVRLKLYF